MSDLVPTDEIEQIVGIQRHHKRHYGRAVSAEETVYILHSHQCKSSGIDLRECRYSVALDQGIDERDWADAMDVPVRLTINRSGRLITAVPGKEWRR